MIYRALAVVLTLAVFTDTAAAAARETVRTNWQNFRDQVKSRNLQNGHIRVELRNGKRVKTRYVDATDDALIVPASRGTREWKRSDREAGIPRADIASVWFSDRRGKGRLLGTLAGAGAGAGTAAAIASGTDISEGAGVIIIPVIAACAAIGITVAGYYIGRAMDHHGPEFVFTE